MTKLLKPCEVAELLSVSRAQIYAVIANGQLEAIRVNRLLRVEPEAVERFKARHVVKIAKTAPAPVRSPIRRSMLGTDRYVS